MILPPDDLSRGTGVSYQRSCATPLFRHREEAGGRRGDLKHVKTITIEIATVAALLRNDKLKGVGVIFQRELDDS